MKRGRPLFMPRRPLFTFLPNYLQFFASKCSILAVEMFNSWRQNVQFSPSKCSILGCKMFKSRLQNVQISSSKCSILGCKMFKSLAKIMISSFIYKYLREKVFCAALCIFLFSFPSHTLGRNDEAAVLFGMWDAEARNRVGGSGEAV